MKRLAMVFLLLALGVPRGAVAQLPSVTLPPELDRVLRDYEREWKAGSASGLVALFVEDGFVGRWQIVADMDNADRGR